MAEGALLVRVGLEGEHTHIYDPETGAHLCRSGIKKGKVPPLYQSDAKYVTCYRCQKLAEINRRKGVKMIRPPAEISDILGEG